MPPRHGKSHIGMVCGAALLMLRFHAQPFQLLNSTLCSCLANAVMFLNHLVHNLVPQDVL